MSEVDPTRKFKKKLYFLIDRLWYNRLKQNVCSMLHTLNEDCLFIIFICILLSSDSNVYYYNYF